MDRSVLEGADTKKRVRAFLAAVGMWINERTGGEKGQYLCARLADQYGPYSWPCRLLDRVMDEHAHCRKQMFSWRYRR